MRKLFSVRSLALLLAGTLLFGAGIVVGQKKAAGQKTLIHTIAFKQVEGTTPEKLQEVWAATLKMAGQVPGIKSVWMGKVTNRGEDLTHGIVMEFENQAALKAYAPHPAHKEWEKVYFKVRVEGTDTIDIQGE